VIPGRNGSAAGAVCVLLTGALGDFLLALPALSALRALFPESRIDLLGNPLWLPLAAECTALDRVLSVDDVPIHQGFTDSLRAEAALPRFLAGYDLLLSWFGDREGTWKRNLERVAPGKAHVFPSHKAHGFPGHASDYYLHTLRAAGFGAPAPAPDPPWPAERCWKPPSRPAAGGLLCIHPGSGSVRKNWPPERFLAVAEALHERGGMAVRILLGPAEANQRAFWRERGGTRFDVRTDPPLLDLFRSLAGAALYLGNDSGVTHLAASLGVPTVALFGPTDPGRWAPRGPRVRVLRNPVPAPGGAADGTGGEGEGRATADGPPCMEPEEVINALAALR